MRSFLSNILQYVCKCVHNVCNIEYYLQNIIYYTTFQANYYRCTNIYLYIYIYFMFFMFFRKVTAILKSYSVVVVAIVVLSSMFVYFRVQAQLYATKQKELERELKVFRANKRYLKRKIPSQQEHSEVRFIETYRRFDRFPDRRSSGIYNHTISLKTVAT